MPILNLDQGLVLAMVALCVPPLALLALVASDLRAARRSPPGRRVTPRPSSRPRRTLGEPRPFAAPPRAPRR